MRLFVNNVDGFLATAICADLWKLTHQIIGTKKGCQNDAAPPVVKRVVPRWDVRRFLKSVAGCDVVIFDLHDADLEELEIVLRTLHTSTLTHEMIFILISSVGVWGRTQRVYEPTPQLLLSPPGQKAEVPTARLPDTAPPTRQHTASKRNNVAEMTSKPVEQSVKGEITPIPMTRPRSFQSQDYVYREPLPKFQEWKTMETLVLALKGKGTISPYVVCAGIPYGNGEEPFLGLFKAAWQSRQTLRTIGDGTNYIPLVHARDVARLVRCIVEEKPELDYHLAVDRGDLTQRTLIQAVAREFGILNSVSSVSIPEAVLAEFADILTLDLRLEPCPFMRDVSKFHWWSELGIAENIGKVASEFSRWRRLLQTRIIITGSPGCGSCEVGKMIADWYNLPLLVFDKLVEEHRGRDTPIGEKLDEIAAAFAANPSKGQAPTALPTTLTTQLVETALEQPHVRYRGYVLTGYPRNMEDASELLLEDSPPPPTMSEGGEADAEKPAESVVLEKVWRKSVAPEVVIVLSSPDDACSARLQVAENEFKHRMEKWKKENPDQGQQLKEFFHEKSGTEPIVAEVGPGDSSYTYIAELISRQVNETCVMRNFQVQRPFGHEQEVDKVIHAEVTLDEGEAALQEAEETRRRKEDEESLERIRLEEVARLEKNSEQMRQYLMTFVVPSLAGGLTEVCNERPEDPVGYLAEYIAVCAQLGKGRVAPPLNKSSNALLH